MAFSDRLMCLINEGFFNLSLYCIYEVGNFV